MLTLQAIKKEIRPLLVEYGFLGAVLFGSYADGTASGNSDIDLYVNVPDGTKTKQVFAFAYDLGEKLGATVDAYGSHEVPVSSSLYQQIQTKGVVL